MAAPRRGNEEVAVVVPMPFGRYALFEPIGEGRTGTVYRAGLRRDRGRDTLCAIKRVPLELSSDAAFAARFHDVMSRAADLEHPAHCAIEDVGRADDGSLYIAMELLSGKDLARIAAAVRERGEAVPAALVAYIGICVADVLAAAHASKRAGKLAPLHHGELGHADIVIAYDGAVRVTGFGSAALQAESPDPAPRYAYRAPELARGICNGRSDVFSLGACMYELMTGGRDDTANGKRESHITQVVPRALELIVGRALAEDPAERWESANEFSRAIAYWCSTQSARADREALAAFMRGLFEHADEAERKHREACLARLAGTRPQPGAAPPPQPARDARPSYAQLVRASESSRSSVPARARSERAEPQKPASAAPPGTKPESWVDPAEQTPARGNLMQELAAEMAAAAPRSPEPPTPTVDGWDDESHSDRWISESEERDVSDWRLSHKPAPAKVTAPAPLVAPPMPVRSVAAAPQLAALPWLPTEVSRSASGVSPRTLIGAGAGLLVLAAAVVALRSSGSEPAADEPQQPIAAALPAVAAVPPAVREVGTVPAVAAAAPAGDAVPGAQRPQVMEPAPQPESQVARVRDDQPAYDRGASQRRRALDEQAEPAFASDEASARADEPEPAEPVVAIRARNEPIAAAPVAASPAVPVPVPVAAAPAAPPRVAAAAPAAAPRAPAPSVSRSPVQPAVLIEKTTPRLPARAKRTGITQGFVSVEFTVDRNGSVTNPSVLKAEPAGLFDEAALKALREWRYRPARQNGAAVESKQRLTIRFAEGEE